MIHFRHLRSCFVVSVHPIGLTGTRKVVQFCCMLGWIYHLVFLKINVKLALKLFLISNHLECLNRVMDEFSKNYDNVIFLGDFNICINDNAMTSFCSLNDLTSLIDQPTYYKNPNKSTCIDLILMNRPNYFQKTMSLKQASLTFILWL